MNVPGYSIVKYDGENRNTGGIVIYIRNNIRYERIFTRKIDQIVGTLRLNFNVSKSVKFIFDVE